MSVLHSQVFDHSSGNALKYIQAYYYRLQYLILFVKYNIIIKVFRQMHRLFQLIIQMKFRLGIGISKGGLNFFFQSKIVQLGKFHQVHSTCQGRRWPDQKRGNKRTTYGVKSEPRTQRSRRCPNLSTIAFHLDSLCIIIKQASPSKVYYSTISFHLLFLYPFFYEMKTYMKFKVNAVLFNKSFYNADENLKMDHPHKSSAKILEEKDGMKKLNHREAKILKRIIYWAVFFQFVFNLHKMQQKLKEGKETSISREQVSFTSIYNDSISSLRRRVMLSTSELIECQNNDGNFIPISIDKFYEMLERYNGHGIEKIHQEEFEQAIIYFGEAQRLLQYGASIGKFIDRAHIITVLNNEACAYQRIYDLPKLSNYLEALLHNLQLWLKKTELKINTDSCIPLKNHFSNEIMGDYLVRKRQFYIYHLQYCALNSKNYQHQTAISLAHDAIHLMKEICFVCFQYERKKQSKIKIQEESSYPMKNIFQELSAIDSKLEIQSYEICLKKVKNLINQRMKFSGENKFEEAFCDFSIGKIMQIFPTTFQSAKQVILMEDQCSEIEKIKKALYISAGFFTIGTQLRLMSSKSKVRFDHNKSSDQFMLSELYHLYCIFLVLTYVPCDTLYLGHLLTSYNNHYSIDLTAQDDASHDQVHEEKQQSEHKCAFLLDKLPQHSELEHEGESKWSKSRAHQSQSSEKCSDKYLSEKKISSHKKSKSTSSTKKKNKYSIQYKFKNKLHSNPTHSFQVGEQEKNLCEKVKATKVKTQISAAKKGSSLGKSNGKKKIQKKRQGNDGLTVKEFLGEKNHRKTKSKEKPNPQISNSKTKDFFKGLRTQLRETNDKQKRSEYEQKRSKEKKQSRQKKTIKNGNVQSGLKGIFQQLTDRNCEKTIRRSKPKKSLEGKKKIKRTNY